MTCSQENTTGRLLYSNNMAGSRSAQNAILSDHQFLNTIRGTNLGDQLHDLGVPVSSIPTNDQKAAIDAFGDG